MSSPSSTERGRIEPGMEVAGFRLEGELGRGAATVVYEATQLALGRRVALKLLPQGDLPQGPLRWPDHPRVVSMYAAGSWEGGHFVAMQLVRGPTLAHLLAANELHPADALALLADVAPALDDAHRAGIVHGRVTARNILVDRDGRALLSDFGLAAPGASRDADRADFAALVAECSRRPPPADPRSHSASSLVRLAREGVPGPPQAGRAGRRKPALAAAAAVALGAIPIAIVLARDEEQGSVPAVERGTLALGSDLASGGIRSVDCAGRRPSGSSQACTLVQTELPGRRLVPSRAGAIRRWAVRGARGELALQVIRRRGGRYVSAARSRFERVFGEGVQVMRANLAVRPGDRLGIEMAPGAAVGVRRGVAGATTARWLGPLSLVARGVELGEGTGFDHEVLVRAEYAPGAEPRLPGRLTGRSARRAPAGRALMSRTVEVRGGVRRLTVVALRSGIAVDLFAGGRRLARVPAQDADPAGRLLSLTGIVPVTVRWRNPDGRMVKLEYTVGARTLSPRG